MSLWDPLLRVAALDAFGRPLAVRTEVCAAQDLVDKVATGGLDIAIVYAP